MIYLALVLFVTMGMTDDTVVEVAERDANAAGHRSQAPTAVATPVDDGYPAVAQPAVAASSIGDELAITWYTIKGGGGLSAQGPYVLAGSFCPWDAWSSSGSGLTVQGGFWPGANTPLAPPPTCAADLSDDGIVDGADLGALLGAWGPCEDTCPADLDGDGLVSGSDLGILLGAWGPCN